MNTRRAFLIGSARCAVAACALSFGPDLAGLPIFEVDGHAEGAERRYPVPPGDSVNIDRGASLILVRKGALVYAFSLACPHEQAAVKWVENAKQFQCTKHDSHYDPVGVHTSGRATRNLDRFPVRRDGKDVVVDVSKVWRSDLNPSEWNAAEASAT
jgi:nitrite reductase/ring-hydroxylating ferredoxin subunit